MLQVFAFYKISRLVGYANLPLIAQLYFYSCLSALPLLRMDRWEHVLCSTIRPTFSSVKFTAKNERHSYTHYSIIIYYLFIVRFLFYSHQKNETDLTKLAATITEYTSI